MGASNAVQDWVRAIEAIRGIGERTLPGDFDDIAARYGDRPALVGEGVTLSYAGLAARANRYANWAVAQRFIPGKAVGLLLPNCPDYVAIWFGLTRVGCVVALLNTNLTGEALAHCVAAAGAGAVIAGAGLLARLPAGLRVWVHGGAVPGVPRVEEEIATHSADAPEIGNPPQARSAALLIYTSGTTGLPKAAHVTHGRVLEWSHWFAAIMKAEPADRLYDCLPMYHSVGGVVAVGAMLVAGGAVVIRGRFSASRFWDDVADQDCTIFQYIGELCRYLARAQPQPRETAHRLRLACGNGLGADVWETFRDRFKIPRILEYYAATEGNVSLYNLEGRPGAIGRVPAFLAHRFPVALIRCDPAGEAPLRDAAGFCVKCDVDEPGEAIGRIAADPVRRFDGYTDQAASARKLLHDVFEPGDRWFRTGDLMRKDRAGYYYFVDRLGDTFRWKGENVATTEVAAAIGTCPGVLEAVVFGVAVPGHEGRAGMAAITAAADFSLAALRVHLAARLPDYAQPLFVRLCDRLETTGTFKLKKDVLQRDGFAPGPDPVWFNDRAKGRFVPWDEALQAALATGELTRL